MSNSELGVKLQTLGILIALVGGIAAFVAFSGNAGGVTDAFGLIGVVLIAQVFFYTGTAAR